MDVTRDGRQESSKPLPSLSTISSSTSSVEQSDTPKDEQIKLNEIDEDCEMASIHEKTDQLCERVMHQGTEEEEEDEEEDELISKRETSIQDLPSSILEFILMNLSPYKDLGECRLVCRAWNEAAKSAIKTLQRNFIASLSTLSMEWHHYTPAGGPTISARYSHSACYANNSMYIFGGCTASNTTFNDLWRFDLATRSWIRPLASGTFPPPKACASLVAHGNRLILFGGWSHSSPRPLRQDWQLFNQIHVFDIIANKWSLCFPQYSGPTVAGHTASVVDNDMIVFGGLQLNTGENQSLTASNEVWVMHLQTGFWRLVKTSLPRPAARYGHSQVIIDSHHLLIMGGCGGPNMLLTDAWLLEIPKDDPLGIWQWHKVDIVPAADFTSPSFSFHPACKINNLVLILSKSQVTRKLDSQESLLRKPLPRALSKPKQQSSSSDSTTKFLQESKVPDMSNASCKACSPASHSNGHLAAAGLSVSSKVFCSKKDMNSQKRLDSLKKMEQKLLQNRSSPNSVATPSTSKSEASSSSPSTSSAIAGQAQTIHSHTQKQHSPPHTCSNSMVLYAMDISKVITDKKAYWTPPKNFDEAGGGPQEMILYSLIAGRAEIIMFGGIEKNTTRSGLQPYAGPEHITNAVHVIQAKRRVL